jgi:hypothetical protein
MFVILTICAAQGYFRNNDRKEIRKRERRERRTNN